MAPVEVTHPKLHRQHQLNLMSLNFLKQKTGHTGEKGEWVWEELSGAGGGGQ